KVHLAGRALRIWNSGKPPQPAPPGATLCSTTGRTLTEFLLAGESVMCAPSVIQTALAGLSRRELLQVAAGLAAGTALAPPALKADEEPAVRSIGMSKVVDLTHTLSPKFPVIPIPGLTFPIKITAIATLEKLGVAVNKWELMDHNGTHIDA